jgi:hypothetical protein
VIPNQPPAEIRILSASIAQNSDLLITWTAEAGKTYRIQFKDDLNAPGWTDLTDVLASGPLAFHSIPRGAEPRRFYQIQLRSP